jgi:hypothetical protein
MRHSHAKATDQDGREGQRLTEAPENVASGLGGPVRNRQRVPIMPKLGTSPSYWYIRSFVHGESGGFWSGLVAGS